MKGSKATSDLLSGSVQAGAPKGSPETVTNLKNLGKAATSSPSGPH